MKNAHLIFGTVLALLAGGISFASGDHAATPTTATTTTAPAAQEPTPPAKSTETSPPIVAKLCPECI